MGMGMTTISLGLASLLISKGIKQNKEASRTSSFIIAGCLLGLATFDTIDHFKK